MSAHFDVVVAGLGAMGSAAAHRLAARGLNVLGLDRFRPPHTLGSSHGRTRVIREAYFEDPAYVRLVQRALRLWRELEIETGRPLLTTTGAVVLGDPASEAIDGSLRSAREFGIPHERLDADGVRAAFPALSPTSGMIGVYEPGAGALTVEACVAAQLELARRHGAELAFAEPLESWRPAGERYELRTSRRSLSAATLVLAAGAWLTRLVPELPLEVVRQVQLWYRPLRDASRLRPPACPIFLWELADGAMYYGLPDLGDGVKAARHHGGPKTDVDAVSREVTGAEIEDVRRFLAEYVPAAAGELLDASVCLYTNTPDLHFLIDQHPDHAGVWLLSPCSGHGFKFAPAIGEVVAEAVSGSPPLLPPIFSAARLLLRRG